MDPKRLRERWGRRPTLAPVLVSALEGLARLATDRPELANPSRTLADVLKAAFHPPDSGSIDSSDLEFLTRGWSEGRPAFQQYLPRLDPSVLMARSRRLILALGAENESARNLDRAIRSRKIDLLACANQALAGRPKAVTSLAETVGIDPLLTSSVLRFTVLPSLAPISIKLDRLRAEGIWNRGDCPNCGSRPMVAESRGLEQRIFYRCGLCAGDWPGERLRCPSCGENSPKALEYSYVEGEQDRYRLAHCHACLYDWKVVSTLTALSAPAMIVADLATVHLDVLADDRRSTAS